MYESRVELLNKFNSEEGVQPPSNDNSTNRASSPKI